MTTAPASQPHAAGLWRRSLRRLRRIALLAVVLAAGLLTYLHWFGLPNVAKEQLKQQMRLRGIEMDCGRIRFRWYRGIVAEAVSLGPTNQPQGLKVQLPEVAFRVDPRALLRFQLLVQSLDIEGGRLTLPVVSRAEAPRSLTLDQLRAELRFGADDTWSLDHLSAECLGIIVRVQGTMSHASAMRRWPLRAEPAAEPDPWTTALERFIRQMTRLTFPKSPILEVDFHGDATQPASASARVRFTAQNPGTPWGSMESIQALLTLNENSTSSETGRFRMLIETRDARALGLRIAKTRLDSRWHQSFSNAMPNTIEADISLEGISSPWGSLSRLHLVGDGAPLPDYPNFVGLNLQLAGDNMAAAGGESGGTRLNLRLVHDLQFSLKSSAWALQMDAPHFSWGQAESLRIDGHFERLIGSSAVAIPSGSPLWDFVTPFAAACTGRLERLVVSNTPLDRISFGARWNAPLFTVPSIEVDLFDRHLRAQFDCNVTNRELSGDIAFNFDVRRLQNLLPDRIQTWIDRYSWRPNRPPEVGAHFWYRLPPWTNLLATAALKESTSDLGLRGSLVASDGAYRGMAMDDVAFDFQFTNEVWRLTDFVASAPEGRFIMAYTEDQRTRDYRFDIQAQLDPRAFRALAPESTRKAFDLFEFDAPPEIEGNISGRWRSPELTGFSGTLRCLPFRFRHEPIEELTARLEFTNGTVRATDVRLRSDGFITAEAVAYSVPHQRLSLVEAHSTVPPMRVARAIGSNVVRTLSPYVFDRPPRARVDGWLNVHDSRQVGLRFEVAGGPFHYWRFNLPEIQAAVSWSNQTVQIDNLQAPFYGGRARGNIDLDVESGRAPALSFDSHFEEVDFSSLMRDLLDSTNRFEGLVDGTWTLTHANVNDWDSWDGFGRVELKQGYLWELPLFGGLTEVMGRLGLEGGKSRITGMTADFTMTNSLIHTSNLQLESRVMSLDYRGTFDFHGGVDARVEARLLHGAAVVGPLVSLLFSPLTKMFEFKVDGTLAAPRIEPLYIPKPLLFPLNPIGTLKEMFKTDPTPIPP